MSVGGRGWLGSAASAVGCCFWVRTRLPSSGEGQKGLAAACGGEGGHCSKEENRMGRGVKVGSRVKSRGLNFSLAEGYGRGSC